MSLTKRRETVGYGRLTVETLESRLLLAGNNPQFDSVETFDSTIDVAAEVKVAATDPESEPVSFVATAVPPVSNDEFLVKPGDQVIGGIEAKVVFIEFVDFQ